MSNQPTEPQPKQIGRYQILHELGRGGMAVVYLAQDPRIKTRHVAVKVLPRQFSFYPDFRRRFQQEVETIALLEHPAIVPVYDFGEDGDVPYIVMRYMPGGTLRQRMQGQPFTVPQVSDWLARLAPALDKAHQQGIIHRDLKPDNILFDADNLPYLSDFGIARVAEATQTMTMIGTPAYMSPEQWESGKVDSRSDLYALGVILFELLTGHPPYSGDTPARLMRQHLLAPPPDPLAYNQRLTPGCQSLLQRALDKKPDNRFPTAAHLLAALQQTTTISGVAAAAGTPPFDPHATLLEDDLQPNFPLSPVATPPISGVAAAAGTSGTSKRRLPSWSWALLLLPLIAFGLFWLLRNGGSTGNEGVLTATGLTATPLPVALPTETLAPTNTPTPSAGSTRIAPTDGMVQVYVPAGEFRMGSEAGSDDERPIHTVYLDAYWLDQTEVTNAQFAQFVAATGHETTAEQEGGGWTFTTSDWNYTPGANWQRPQGPGSNLNGQDNHPVVLVSWYDAVAYCEWAGRRLPTEAEWEKAARGTDERVYPWGNTFDGNRLNYCDANCPFDDWKDDNVDDGYEFTAPVGSYPSGASPYGALDMAGNVWEWVADWYDAGYYARSPARNPTGPTSGDYPVLRGGSWHNLDDFVRAAFRNRNGPSYHDDIVGFRCAQE